MNRLVPALVLLAVALGVSACGQATASTSPPASPPPAKFSGPVARLQAQARSLAASLGDRSVKTFQVVRTTRKLMNVGLAYGPQPNETNAIVYVIEIRGDFVCGGCSRPSNADAPKGHVADIVLRRGDLSETDFSLGDRTARMHVMGRAYTLPIN